MTSPHARRRQRSRRLSGAIALLVLSALLVAVAIVVDNPILLAGSAVAAVVLGAIATRITYVEVIETRILAAHDRAAQARAYAELAAERAAEHGAYVDAIESRIAERETAVVELEGAVSEAQRRAADAIRAVAEATRRAEAAETGRTELQARLDEAETTAADAVLHLAEAEQELDVRRGELDGVRAELAAWQAMGVPDVRNHA